MAHPHWQLIFTNRSPTLVERFFLMSGGLTKIQLLLYTLLKTNYSHIGEKMLKRKLYNLYADWLRKFDTSLTCRFFTLVPGAIIAFAMFSIPEYLMFSEISTFPYATIIGTVAGICFVGFGEIVEPRNRQSPLHIPNKYQHLTKM